MAIPGASTKKRALPFRGTKRGHLRVVREPDNLVISNGFGIVDYKPWQGIQITESIEHPEWSSRKRGSTGDIGGEFLTTKKYVEAKIVPQTLVGRTFSHQSGPTQYWNNARYTGPILPAAPGLLPIPNVPEFSMSSLDAWGTKAIAITKPTNPTADLAVFFGELIREGLPTLIGAKDGRWMDKTRAAQDLGDEYLNIQFGWKPFVSELRAFAHAIAHADKVLRQYERDAGRVVRRRMSFPEERSVSTATHINNVSPFTAPSADVLLLPLDTNKGAVIRVDETTRRRWFSGAFTYYLPKDYYSSSGIREQVAKAKILLGLELTPDVVWNLAPWTWAVDWFTNAGDVISNISDWLTDGLVLRYGYVMEHTIHSRSYRFSGKTGFQSYSRPVVVRTVTETKARRRATPFGFGITWDGLTAAQLAIAAALGITRW